MDIKTDFDWEKGFTVDFDLTTGLSGAKKSTVRRLSAMKDMFSNDNAYKKALSFDDTVIYEFYELGAPESPGGLAFGTSIVYNGKIGDEYFMTKGHFHTILETAEVYYCLSGKGFMLMENPEGDWRAERIEPGKAVYVPERFAHRSINTGNVPLVTFFVFRADAGHNYGTIETNGYRKLIIEKDGSPIIVDNPKWGKVK